MAVGDRYLLAHGPEIRRLPALLDAAADQAPAGRLVVTGGQTRTFPALRAAAQRVAGAAVAAGVGPGDRVVLGVQDLSDFFPLFWGVLWAGATPVPLAGPRDSGAAELGRVGRVLAQVGGTVVVDRGLSWPGLETHDVGDWLAGAPLETAVSGDGPALIQFSSGSTGQPRGVVLSHAQLLANIAQVASRLPVTAADTVHCWMPPFHDMGLIGCHLVPLALAMDQVRLSAVEAVRDPVAWLRGAVDAGCTVLTSTNLGMVRLTAALSRQGLAGLDLSAVRLFVTGAEPISAEACRQFCDTTGLPDTVHYPMYGLAEATVGVASPRQGGLATVTLDGQEVLLEGPPLEGVSVRVLGPAGQVLPEGQVGRLQVRGPNVTGGYLDDPEATAALFEGDWLRTGDLGALVAGQVAVIGRHKDVVCVGGRNLHAHDVEALAEDVPGVRPGGAVAVADRRGLSEGLAVLVRLDPDVPHAPVLWALHRRITGGCGVAPTVVLPLDRLPRTTSGKKQRAALAEDLAQGRLDLAVGNTLEGVRQAWSQVLERSLGEGDLDADFASLGGGSLQAVAVLDRLERLLGVAPDHRLLLQGHTVRRLAILLERHPPKGVVSPATAPAQGETLVISGAACRLPGAADPAAFWALAAEGGSAIGLAPADRRPAVGEQVGGWLASVDRFDADAFGLGAAEAAALDPQQRLLLELARELQDVAGSLAGQRLGVFIGAGQQAYLETVLGGLDGPLPPGTMAGNLLSLLAARLSHQFDWTGPALTLDTACSASLVALHLAARSVRDGECDGALVGGVNLNLTGTAHALFGVAGALSPTGRCRPFCDDADGMVPGEGAVLMLLEPAATATAAGRPVLATLLGSAINNDGASLGVMAPNPAGQEAVVRAALVAAGVSAETVDFVEAHGTGTPVGDAVERGVLDRIYGPGPVRGASNASVGHLLGAAGAVGLLRVLGALDPGQRGAVSSFGFGGTNAHVLVERPSDAAPWLPARARDAGPRHWLGEQSPAGWVHQVQADPGGGVNLVPCEPGAPVLRPGGHYLVTGASGGLGRRLCRYLDARYGARLVLVSRRPDPVQLSGLRRATGLAVDLAGPGVGEALAGLPALDGVFHLAGGLDADALRAKTAPLQDLAGLGAGFLCLFSSVAALLPGLALGEYSQANQALDHFARTARGHVVSIAWGPWADSGLAAAHGQAYAARGLVPIPPALGLRALEQALDSRHAHVAVMSRPDPVATRATGAGADTETLRGLLAEAAELPLDEVPDSLPLPGLGIDSVQGLDLIETLEAAVGRSLPTTLLYEHGTVGALLGALASGTRRLEAPAAPAAGPSDDAPTLPAQANFLAQQAYFPDLPGNVLLGCDVAAPGLDRTRLGAALAALVSRHPAVATRFERGRAGWRQRPGPGPSLRWVGTVDEQAVHAEPFDVSAGPLLRVVSDGRRLVLSAHHAAVDAWSLQVLMRELLLLHQQDPGLESAPATTWRQAAASLAQVVPGDPGWWQARFSDGVPALNLAWSGPVARPAQGPPQVLNRSLSGAMTAALRAAADAAGVSLPALVLAAYLQVLWDASGQHDLVVRVAQGRREARLPDLERVVGSFADSLPLRVAVVAGEPLAGLAQRTHQALTEVRRRAHASASALARLAPAGAEGPAGLAPIGFSFPLLPAPAELAGLQLSGVTAATASGFTRLGLVAWVFDGRLHLSWNSVASHLTPAVVAGIAGRLEALLASPASTRTLPITLQGRVMATCARVPERPALGSLSYGELARRSRDLAASLEGARIAVLAPPGADAVVALLGVLRSGAAFVPLDPGWPEARIQQILAVARPSCLVVPAALAGVDRGVPEHVLGTEPSAPEDWADPPGEPDGLAYVMFTSGTSGRPKGVCVSHRAVLAFQDWVLRVFGVTARDRFLQTSSLGFGGAIRQIFTPLLVGASIHPVPPGLTRDPDGLIAFMRQERVTIFNSVPSLWVHLMGALERLSAVDPLPDVRWVLLGGEAVPADPIRRWRASQPRRIRLANLYGSTESVVNATWFEVVRDLPPDARHCPIGRARSGVSVSLVDVVDGVGELVVGGATAAGYLDDPERTAQVFTEHPTLGRIYRTGDLARRLPSGELVHLGRKDSQVQVRGNRVELGEVEHTLTNHPDVMHAVVLQDRGGGLVATVQGPADSDTLRRWLAEQLPAYMVPGRIDVVAALPRSPSGKADRRALAGQLRAAPDVGVATPSDVVAQVAAAWQQVLELRSPPGPSDDFFALGGDSLRLLDVLDALRDRVSPLPSPLALYGQPTLAGMARVIGQAAVSPSAPRVDRAGPFALTQVQTGFWLAHRRDPTRPPTWTVSIPVQGPLDPVALARALRHLVARHDALQVVVGPGPALHRVASLDGLVLQVDDLSELSPLAQVRSLAVRWDEAVAARLPLDRWPLVRVRVCRLGPERHQLLLAAHHLVADAWSAWVLAAELLATHDRARETPSLASGPPAPSMFDHPAPTPSAQDWWAAQLGALPQPPPSPAAAPQAEATLQLDPAAWARLQASARTQGLTPFVLVLTALAQALGDALGAGPRVVSTADLNRDVETQDVVGAYARALPIVIPEDVTAEGVGRAVREAVAHAPASLPPGVHPDVVARFFLTWLDPSVVPAAAARCTLVHDEGRYRFDVGGTGTELLLGALVGRGLRLHLHGRPVVTRVAPLLRARLDRLTRPRIQAALVVYVPAGLPVPVDTPQHLERVDAAAGTSELVLLPLSADDLRAGPDLDAEVDRAVRACQAPVVALAGMLPALTGLGLRPLGRDDQVVTTGHAATVVAMAWTVRAVLASLGRSWTTERVGCLGYGAIGRSTLALCQDLLGEPQAVVLQDPGLAGSAADLQGCTLILGATSGGRALDVAALAPGTVVVDDSFPRCFDDAAARRRMETARDVLLIGGGMLDPGPLERHSRWPQAAALRTRYGSAWLPGCHAEAVLLAAVPSLGPTRGPVDVARARRVADAVAELGWSVAPLHLGAWEVPGALVDDVARVGRP